MIPHNEVATRVSEYEQIYLLSTLVQIQSYNPPGEEARVARRLAEWLAPVAEVTLQEVAPERNNLIARVAGRGARPALLLCAHLDTVPPGNAAWSFDPLGGQIADGRICGRGTLDTKGSLAAMAMTLAAIRRAGIIPSGDLILLATVDEESGGLGARTYVEQGGMAGVGGVVIGEPTSLDLVIAHRGALWLDITARGKAAHGAMPHEGNNAILPMASLLMRLGSHAFAYESHPLLAPPTLNVGTICGGTKTNMVPGECHASVDIRTVPGQPHATMLAEIVKMAEATSAVNPGVQFAIDVTNDKPPLVTAPDAELIRAAKAAARHVLGAEPAVRGAPYLTDGSLLAGTTATPAIVCGPGPQEMAHQVDEYLETSELIRAFRFYCALTMAYLE